MWIHNKYIIKNKTHAGQLHWEARFPSKCAQANCKPNVEKMDKRKLCIHVNLDNKWFIHAAGGTNFPVRCHYTIIEETGQ